MRAMLAYRSFCGRSGKPTSQIECSPYAQKPIKRPPQLCPCFVIETPWRRNRRPLYVKVTPVNRPLRPRTNCCDSCPAASAQPKNPALRASVQPENSKNPLTLPCPDRYSLQWPTVLAVVGSL